MGKRILAAISRWIPQHVPNGLVLRIYDLLCIHRTAASMRADPCLCTADTSPAGYMEDQRHRREETFGRSTVAAAGCEVIAVYNALVYFYGGERIPFPALVHLFSRSGMALGGRFGTSPLALVRFFSRWWRDGAWKTEFVTDRRLFDRIAREYPCLIVSFYNDGEDIRRGVHTVCMTRGDRGWTAHNLTENGRTAGPFADVSQMLTGIAGRHRRGLCVLGLYKPQNS